MWIIELVDDDNEVDRVDSVNVYTEYELADFQYLGYVVYERLQRNGQP